MSGAIGNLIGLSVAGVVAAATDNGEVSAGCVAGVLFICLKVNQPCGAANLTTWTPLLLAFLLFIGVLLGNSATTFLVGTSVLLVFLVASYALSWRGN